MSGINVDYRNPVGSPPASKLAGFKYVRFPYNVSNGTGSLDFDAAAAFYAPKIGALLAAGITPIVVLTHQAWGEGRGFNWQAMSGDDWSRLISGFASACEKVALAHAGMGITYQIWNEQDAASASAVGVPARVYAEMCAVAAEAIQRIDPTARLITGGHVSGPGTGVAYAKAASIPAGIGIGVHLYGVGADGLYGQFGTVENQLAQWRAAFPSARLWVTEFGVLDQPNEPVERVARYARAFVAACRARNIEACWYGWADGMHNGYGVESGGQIRQALFDALTGTPPVTPPTGQPVQRGKYFPASGLKAGNVLNVRAAPTTSAPVLAQITNGSPILPLDEIAPDGVNRWVEIELLSGVRGWASANAAGKLSINL